MELSPDELCSQYSESHSADEQSMTVFRLLPRPVGAGAPGNVQLAFSVPNLDQTIEALRATGAACARERSIEPGCAVPSVCILDPDGNGIVLYQM
jgi:predicted enzyme related to lactoylglutathione lyase